VIDFKNKDGGLAFLKMGHRRPHRNPDAGSADAPIVIVARASIFFAKGDGRITIAFSS
jgi:hypothetical protein